MERIKEKSRQWSEEKKEYKGEFLRRLSETPLETNFYKGKRGLKTAFEDQLRVGKEVLILGASLMSFDILKYYFIWYDRKRIKIF